MLKYNELRIDSNKNLIVDASVLDIVADPNKTISIDSIKIGYGSNEETIDYYETIPTFFDNLDYSYTYNYQVVFTVDNSVNVEENAVYSKDNYTFKIVSIRENLNDTKEIVCVYDEDSAIVMGTSGNLTKVSGTGDDTITYSSFTATRVSTPHLRGFRLVIPLTDSAIITTLGNVANKLIYSYVHINIPADVWEELGNCSNAEYIEGYAYDRCLIVNKVFSYLKEYDTPCSDITNLANYITQINGLQIAIESNRFALANKYWTKFFTNNNITTTSNNNCHCCH